MTKKRTGRVTPSAALPSCRPAALSSSLPLDRYDLYELAVTEPIRLTRFLRAVHGHNPRILREDFSGSGALSRAWAAHEPKARAIAVDRDKEPLERLRTAPRVECVIADVLQSRARADIIAATNFPIGYQHTRADLLAYLRHARRCLRPRGLLVADTYGGPDAFTTGRFTQHLRAPGGRRIDYTWEQRSADPLSARVLDVLHFRVRDPGKKRARVIRDAFVYDWRLWSIPELTGAMLEAGFRKVEVYDRLGSAVDGRGRLHVRPVRDGAELDENYVVYVVGRR